MFSQEKGQPVPDQTSSEAQGLKTCTVECTAESESLFYVQQRPQRP